MMKNDNSMRHMEDLGMDFIPGMSQLFSFIMKLKKLCRETDSLNRLASSLVGRLTPDQEDKSSNPGGRELGMLTTVKKVELGPGLLQLRNTYIQCCQLAHCSVA
jgi:hypothetical protein